MDSEGLDRRGFLRRVFAMGAGFTAAGVLVRQGIWTPTSGRAQVIMAEATTRPYGIGFATYPEWSTQVGISDIRFSQVELDRMIRQVYEDAGLVPVYGLGLLSRTPFRSKFRV
jgi:hypothetical protein